MMVLSTDIVVGAAPPRKAGSAASMLETSGELGVALGVATLGSVGTAVYGAQVDGSIPAGLHPDAAEAARSTLAGALSVADNLSAGAAVQLVDAAKAAFTAGLGTVAGVGAGLAVVLAVLAFRTLRRMPARTDTDADTGTGTGTGTVSPAERSPG
jgi:DHA2 family multidrug resistance protein-like MFS transporter